MRKFFIAVLFAILVAVPTAAVGTTSVFGYSTSALISPPLVTSSPHNKAIILSSLDQVYPMGQYDKSITYYLGQAGYQVTTLTNTNVTINVLLTQLNNYSVVIWRTNTYTWKHIEYWYVGQLASDQLEIQYANDFALGNMNGNAGILGVSLNFFGEYFTTGMLSNVKLVVLLSTDSNGFAFYFTHAGAQAVVFCNGPIALGFGLMDDLTTQVLAELAMGETVYTAMFNAVSPFVQNANPEDPLDSSYKPPFWYLGNGTVTLKL